ncbi:hypothetical protein [Flavobacterium sp.]|uniref:hypothetical protein n=1 Tax=Flavobacterium sp. TaxID=239 RepID=UPI0035273D3A
MKTTFLFITWLFIHFNETYQFDYRLVYENISVKNNTRKIQHFYTNSENNHFHAVTYNLEKDTMKFYFRDNNKMTIMLNLEGNYKSPGKVVIPDSLTTNWSGKNIAKEHYFFSKMNDTILGEKKYTQIKLSPLNPKRAKRKKIGYEIYLVDTNIKMKPFFNESLAFEVWREKKNFPDGLVVEKHYYSYDGKLSYSQVLKEASPVSFELIIKK